MRELLLGPRRFADLKADLTGISANVLTQRLTELIDHGLVRRAALPPPAAAQVYAPTEWGQEADAVVMALGRWATRSPWHDPTLPLSAVSLMMSFRTLFAADRAGDFAAVLAFQIGRDRFRLAVADGGIAVTRAEASDAAATITAPAAAIAAVVYAGQPLSGLEIAGDAALVARFVTLFPLPAKAGHISAR